MSSADELLAYLSDLAGRELTAEDLSAIVSEKTQRGVNLAFVGKQQARRIARLVRPRVQRSNASLSVGTPEEQSSNLLIEGDNLQALASLYRWRGQVDLIVTDPPYNTGNDFRYNDRWDEDPNDPGLGNWVPGDDPARHTKWMKFMYPRLQMMHAMLKSSGVLAICIDHRELFHLGQMLDEIFGESNRLAILNWQKMTAPKNHDTGVSTATEYVLVYARDLARVRTFKLPHSESTAASYRNRDGDERGAWTSTDATLMGGPTHPGQVYGIQNPFSGKIHYPQVGRCWRNERNKMKAAAEAWGVSYENRELGDGLRPALVVRGIGDPLSPAVSEDPVIVASREAASRVRTDVWPQYFWNNSREGRTGEGELRYKTYLSDVAGGVVPTTFWADEDFEPLELGSMSWEHEQSGTSDIGVKELNAVVGRGHGFDTVKPLKLIEKIIRIWSPSDGMVLDPFAGSGTIGHATLRLNSLDGGSRRFILIEQGRPERGDSYAKTLTADRLKRVITGKWANGKGKPLAGGFAFKLLTKQVDANIVLRMERDEMVDTVIASHHDSNRRRGGSLVTIDDLSNKYLVGRNSEGQGFYLVWDGPDGNTDLTEDVYEACVAEGRRAKLEPVYHVYARYNLFGTEDVRFYRIPDQILIDFGLDMRTEAYSDGDDE